MRKLDLDWAGRFVLDGSRANVVPVGEPVVIWGNYGDRQRTESSSDLLRKYAGRVGGTENTPDLFVGGPSLVVDRVSVMGDSRINVKIDHFSLQFYREGQPTPIGFSLSRWLRLGSSPVRLEADSQGFYLNESPVNVKPIGRPVVFKHPNRPRREGFPPIADDVLRGLSRKVGIRVVPNAYVAANPLDRGGLNYLAVQFYEI